MFKNRYKRNSKESCDVTINTFANSNNSSRRTKKNALQLVTKGVESLAITIDDENDDVVIKKPHRRNRKVKEESSKDDSGVDYHIDIWHSISEFLAPEDIGKFAAINISCYKVSKSARFWFSLYKRYYQPVSGMPEILQPSLMVRRYGLRSLVIRSLYYTYPPFSSKCNKKINIDPDILKGRICTEAWLKTVRRKNQWYYNFKLKEPTYNGYGRRRIKPKPDLIEMLDNIDANVDEGCKILQIKATQLYPLPMITGQSLTSFEMKMSFDNGYKDVQIQFSSGPNNYQTCTFNINMVVHARVLDWWHPTFSHSEPLHEGLFSSLLPEECDLCSVAQ